MADTPVPETLETIAEKITALGKSIGQRFGRVDEHFAKVDEQLGRIDQRFATVDQQFAKVDEQLGKIDQHSATVDQQFKSIDQQFAALKSQLGVKIEAVDANVTLVFDAVISLRQLADANTKDHQRFTERLDNHGVRILALESSKPAKS
jgi:archaellum component FlaC